MTRSSPASDVRGPKQLSIDTSRCASIAPPAPVIELIFLQTVAQLLGGDPVLAL